jgi:hypothetical protein
MAYGIVERKSLTAKFVGDIVRNPHAWRGVIDGDGWVSFRDGRYGKDAIIGVVGALPLLDQFKSFVSMFTDSKSSIRRLGSIWTLSFTGIHAFRLACACYGDCTVYLERKWNKAKDIIAWGNEKFLT